MGLLGAHALVKDCPRPREVLCLESVGCYSDSPGSQKLPPGFGWRFPEPAHQIRARDGRADFLLTVQRANSRDLGSRWRDGARAAGLDTLTLQDRRCNGAGQRFTRWIKPLLMDLDRSDHSPFWRARVPTELVTGTALLRNEHNHRAGDTPDTLHYDRLVSVVAACAHAARTGAGTPNLDASEPGARA